MTPDPRPPRTLYDLLYVALLAGSWWIRLTWQLWRRTRYLEEALLREQQKRIALQKRCTDESNAKQKRLVEAFLRGPKATLRELVNDTETPFETKP